MPHRVSGQSKNIAKIVFIKVYDNVIQSRMITLCKKDPVCCYAQLSNSIVLTDYN